jgi:hypothetical protein
MKSKIGLIALLVFLLLLICYNVVAQAPSPPGPVHPPPPAGGGGPIDGGLGLLLALAIGFGAKKLYKTARRDRKE